MFSPNGDRESIRQYSPLVNFIPLCYAPPVLTRSIVCFYLFKPPVMKKDIHPKYFEEAKMHCSCGAIFVTGSTEEALHIEICSQCHPFYTGKKKVVDTLGRVDRFKKMTEKAEKKRTETEKSKAEKKKRVAAKKDAPEAPKKKPTKKTVKK